MPAEGRGDQKWCADCSFPLQDLYKSTRIPLPEQPRRRRQRTFEKCVRSPSTLFLSALVGF